MPALTTTLRQATAFANRAGLALVYPNPDIVLPSLWEAVAGPRPVDWAVRDDAGAFVSFTPEMHRVWRWKDELPEKRLVCVGKHLGRVATMIATSALPALYAGYERAGTAADFRDADLTPLQRDVAECALATGPLSGPQLRRQLATDDKKGVAAAIDALQRMLVLTNAGVVEHEHGWPAVAVDVLPRRWADALRALPSLDEARRSLATIVVRSAGEATAPDVGAVFGWRPRVATAVLDELVDAGALSTRVETTFRIYTARRRAT
ncbi:MAG: winged helix DNA-binding domain-containing protein [Frankia sp.]|nr:winged helix DNA-binding domain-containing protein [Frankia sp.]